MAENDKKESHSRPHFLTQDIVINILLRLPIASCIFRFRCVCKSWRVLLSDPIFIRKILFFRNLADQRSLRILIAGGNLDSVSNIKRFYYSLHSYDTLRPVSAVPGELPFTPDKIRDPWTHLSVVGCCDGVFCISDANQLSASDIILWNPTTSETKFLPRSPCPRAPNGLIKGCESIGFGFDPLTNDYKVVRTLKFVGNEYDDDSDDDFGYGYGYGYRHARPRPRPITYKEVYSLKNGSWKKLADTSCLVGWTPGYVRQDTSRNEKCYWHYSTGDGNFYLITFDMSREVFEDITISAPPRRDEWLSESCFMLKKALVTTFDAIDPDDCGSMEVWALMKYDGASRRDQKRRKRYRVSKCWIKLYTFRAYLYHRNLEVWKEGMCICSRRDASHNPNAKDTDEGVFLLDPVIGETTGDALEIRGGGTHSFQARAYTPTLVSLSELE